MARQTKRGGAKSPISAEAKTNKLRPWVGIVTGLAVFGCFVWGFLSYWQWAKETPAYKVTGALEVFLYILFIAQILGGLILPWVIGVWASDRYDDHVVHREARRAHPVTAEPSWAWPSPFRASDTGDASPDAG
jgi:hypothetical protein